jgi:diaminohydroxyphosphoribosylaminopyrimidine deaminase/5-amino-6-(5-phosphoribosylamino)uracil reductase
LTSDEKFMRQALRLAARGRGRTAPNPMVGCVIVKAGRVLATGWHRRAGSDHAEVAALRRLGMRAPGATVYVTLEPCNHVGRTGRCTEALIAAGVGRVVAGMRDPNPIARGGVRRLRAAGIDVTVGVLEAECRALNAAWIHFTATGRPRVTLKAAVTLDGRLAARGGDSRWVTGERARREAHRMRDRADAVLVGARTVALDDPQLTTRLPRGRDPLRVILDGRLSVPEGARALPGALVVTTLEAEVRDELARRGAEILQLPGAGGRVEMHALLEALGRRGITSLLVEGGGEVHGQLLEAGLVDEVAIFIAPKLVGAGGVPLVAVPGPTSLAEAWRLEGISTRRLGDDILVTGRVAGRSTPPRRMVRSD